MAGSDHGTGHIVQSLIVNVIIAVAKLGAALITGSGALLAEAIHTFADCGNQLLLLKGVKEGKRPPDAAHPLGYGRTVYFWSFMVALLLFTGGGVFSIYEGVHHFLHPEPIESAGVAVGILLFSLALEGWATLGNIKEMNGRRGQTSFFQFLKNTKDSDLVVVFGENAAAVLGLGFALVAVGLASVTGDSRFDALGSLGVGVILVGVAVFLAVEVKSLLVGEAADPEISAAVTDVAGAHADIERVLACITMQQGPGEVLVAVKLKMRTGLDGAQLVRAINEFEAELQSRRPEVRWSFVEPDDTADDDERSKHERLSGPHAQATPASLA